jgi:hypothetical protein
MVVPIDMKKLGGDVSTEVDENVAKMAYPKVAADPAMYCPSVLIIPLGPGPNLIMFVAPEIGIRRLMGCGNCVVEEHTEDESDDQSNSYRFGNQQDRTRF